MNDETTAMTSLSAVQFGSDRLLPFDIVKAIFSFIEQSDCLECMLVSHSWYQAVPQYASLIWETVNFTKSKVDTERFWMCLGPHVRHVVLKDDIYFILYKLIQHHCCNIESISKFFLYLI
ncbi:hypothetical protein BDA99DRAFT_517422 [Phascolomyces articulosus]|uniref:F-box domain-containing protein n=1 Tax=Phascolomyces articulosus TaxID=60185 RepID=A0AAD5K4M4_9FUNG|nr:hypothetical protein BDA99DRAFT_517422 [Phascolomyces articulosus]